MPSRVERCCGNPKCNNDGIHLCSGCNEEIYCSKSCQKAHWAEHKALCQKSIDKKEKEKEARKVPAITTAPTKSFESLSIKQLKTAVKAKTAGYERDRRTKILDQMEDIVEKPALVKFVAEQVSLAEVDSLLSPVVPDSSSVRSPSTSTSKHRDSSAADRSRGQSQPRRQQGQQAVPTPEQVRQQAAWMRSQPEAVRRSNAALARFTDEQIKEYANQLELAAQDPNTMKEIEKMSRMDPAARDRLQSLQEGLAGVRPMDEAWVNSAVDTFKQHTEIIKSMVKGRGAMLGGVTDDQLFSFIDGLSRMDASVLRVIVRVLLFLGSLVKPATDWYKWADKASLGLAFYVLVALAGIALYVWALITYSVLAWVYRFLFAATAATIKTAAPAAANKSTGGSASIFNAVPAALSAVANTLTAALGLRQMQQSAATSSPADVFNSPGSSGESTSGSDLEDF